LPLADALEHWLHRAPGAPIPFDDAAAQGVLRTLHRGLDATIVQALAVRPRTLIELSAEITDLNYPALKRRFNKLRSTHLIHPLPVDNASAYSPTEWLRQAVVPLVLAVHWESRHDSDAEPISPSEAEALFLLALP